MRTQLPRAPLGLDSHPGLLLQRYVSHPGDEDLLGTGVVAAGLQGLADLVQQPGRVHSRCGLGRGTGDRVHGDLLGDRAGKIETHS